jgi:hypothetical protein
VGANTITVSGTNASGSAASDSVTITRQGEGSSQTIWFQGFEGGGSDTWGFSGSGSSAGTAARTGSFGRELDSTESITLEAVSIADYSGMTLTVHNASAGGIENADRLEVYVALDGASFSGTPDVWIGEGITNDTSYNKTWDYSATGVASTTAGVPVRCHGDGASGYATILITIPDGSTSISVQVSANNNKTTEYFHIDDIELTGLSSGSDEDVDDDGMPNWWEEQHGGGTTNLDANTDNDGDGLSNLEEWIAYCDPTNSGSCFLTDDIQPASAGDDCVIRWNSATSRLYGVWWATNLIDGFSNMASNLPATPPENAYTDTTHSADACGFYRIDVRMDE